MDIEHVKRIVTPKGHGILWQGIKQGLLPATLFCPWEPQEKTPYKNQKEVRINSSNQYALAFMKTAETMQINVWGGN